MLGFFLFIISTWQFAFVLVVLIFVNWLRQCGVVVLWKVVVFVIFPFMLFRRLFAFFKAGMERVVEMEMLVFGQERDRQRRSEQRSALVHQKLLNFLAQLEKLGRRFEGARKRIRTAKLTSGCTGVSRNIFGI